MIKTIRIAYDKIKAKDSEFTSMEEWFRELIRVFREKK